MRNVLMGLMIAGLMSTVGVYAAGLGGTPTIKTVGGTASETVGSPVSAAISVDWVFTGDQVSGANITWTPLAATTYDINLGAGGQTGSMTTPTTTASEQRTDLVTLGSPVEASVVATAKVVIAEN